MDANSAIEFLASEVERQASLENLKLTDVERKMLRFSEVEPLAFNDPFVAQEFERDYDDIGYEEKIAGLVERAYERRGATTDFWKQAKVALKGHDYYLLVMVGSALGW